MPKRKKTTVLKTAFENDPTTERLRQADGVVDQFKADSGRQIKRLNSLLDYMLGRGQIDAFQHAAGKQAWEQWNIAEFSGLGAVDLSAVRVDGATGGDAMDRRLDAAKRFGAAMQAIGHTSGRAFRAMVLHEMPPATYGAALYGLKDLASARSAGFAVLIDAVTGLDIHYTGGKRPDNAKIRSHIARDGRPSNRRDLRSKSG